MKKYSIITILSLTFLFMTTLASFAQNPLEITLKIDFGEWVKGDSTTFYDAVTFSDNYRGSMGAGNPDNGKRGRSFKSKVRRNQDLKWISDVRNEPANLKQILLINVMRNPKPGMGGNELFTRSWYNSIDGKSISGKIKNVDVRVYESERYLISFAVIYDDWSFDIYTVDPIIRGSDN